MHRNYLALIGATIAMSATIGPIASSRGASVVPPAQTAAKSAKPETMPLYPGLGPVHHHVTTASPLAQKYFDQGLAFTYGFNHYEAELSFQQAAKIDPKMAMAYWGMALVLGPNYNMPGDSDRNRRARETVAYAKTLAPGLSPEERALIDALAKRYGANGGASTAGDQAYADAMRKVAREYPRDPDVQTLFAESLMDLHPWRLWSSDGKPGPDTIEIVTTLETVLKQAPDNIGANHYYIHAVEASPDPARAMPSAERLGALAPGAGHLVHMPSHIYIRTGRFHAAAEANAHAIKVDQAFLAKSKEKGVYPLVYYTHNVHFLCYAQMIEGRKRDALRTARILETMVSPADVRAMPMAEFLVPMPYFVEARFAMWDEVLKEPQPPKDLVFSVAMWRYARTIAYLGKHNRAAAGREQRQLDIAIAAIPPDRPLGTSNHALDVAKVAGEIASGEIAAARGSRKQALAHLTEAVRLQDALNYEEPPMWYYPVRESLGDQLLAMGRTREAEAVYRDDLEKNPGNPRSLYGLAQCLSVQGRTDEASRVREQFRKAWRFADSEPVAAPVSGRRIRG
jgi:tetratricopeptide (TPR) repeat protein